MRITKDDLLLISSVYHEKHWGATRIRNFFLAKNWSIRSVRRVLQRIRTTGTPNRRRGSGRRATVNTAANRQIVHQLIVSPPQSPRKHLSPRMITRRTGLARTSVQRIVKSLNLKVFKRLPVQKLTAAQKLRRVICCRELLRRFPARQMQNIFFTDEKLFTIETPKNTQNDRVYSTARKKCNIPADNLCSPRSHFSRGVMVCLGVSKYHKGTIHFVEQGVKVNAEYYQRHILQGCYFPDCIRFFENHRYTFQQDSAPSHRAFSTIRLLQRSVPDFISPESWPPYSPDINPLDYLVWKVLQEKVYKGFELQNEQQLRQRIQHCWNRVRLATITSGIKQWRDRLQKCIDVHGGYIEQYFP